MCSRLASMVTSRDDSLMQRLFLRLATASGLNAFNACNSSNSLDAGKRTNQPCEPRCIGVPGEQDSPLFFLAFGGGSPEYVFDNKVLGTRPGRTAGIDAICATIGSTFHLDVVIHVPAIVEQFFGIITSPTV